MPETNENLEPTPKGEEVNYDDLLKSDERFLHGLNQRPKSSRNRRAGSGPEMEDHARQQHERSGALAQYDGGGTSGVLP